MNDGSVAVRRLAKRFGVVDALRGVDLDVKPGEVVALLGPNGSGKSTLLRILSTVVLPDAGSASVAGHDVVANPGAARRCAGAMLGDERALYWRLTGQENLEFFGALHGLRRSRAAARARELLSKMGLEAAGDRPCRGYSSGMRTRLLLARAILGEPPVLLLDEPTRNLDPLAAAGFREQVATLAKGGTAILLATHDLHEAAEVASRVVSLSGGEVAFVRDGATSAPELTEAMAEAER